MSEPIGRRRLFHITTGAIAWLAALPGWQACAPLFDPAKAASGSGPSKGNEMTANTDPGEIGRAHV